MAALIIFIVSLGFVFTPQDYYYSGYRHHKPENELSTIYGTRIIHDSGEAFYGAEYSHGETNLDYNLQYKGGIYQSSEGSSFFSLGLKKDIFFHERFMLTAHLMPTLSFIKGNDKEYSSGYLNFNATLEGSFLITRGLSIGAGIMHISNADTASPNRGINLLTISLRASF